MAAAHGSPFERMSDIFIDLALFVAHFPKFSTNPILRFKENTKRKLRQIKRCLLLLKQVRKILERNFNLTFYSNFLFSSVTLFKTKFWYNIHQSQWFFTYASACTFTKLRIFVTLKIIGSVFFELWLIQTRT